MTVVVVGTLKAEAVAEGAVVGTLKAEVVAEEAVVGPTLAVQGADMKDVGNTAEIAYSQLHPLMVVLRGSEFHSIPPIQFLGTQFFLHPTTQIDPNHQNDHDHDHDHDHDGCGDDCIQ